MTPDDVSIADHKKAVEHMHGVPVGFIESDDVDRYAEQERRVRWRP
jgi:hypothetical protein